MHLIYVKTSLLPKIHINAVVSSELYLNLIKIWIN